MQKKMKAYASFDLWKKDQSKKNQALIAVLRKLVNSSGLPLEEAVKWSNGCWTQGKIPYVYIYAFKDGIQFGFLPGSSLKDPKGLLEGKGKHVRFIIIKSKSDIDGKYFTTLMKQAIKIKYR